jgi:hypothetical protein
MAMTDYFYPCWKLESKTISDGLGGFETVEYVGIEFQGLAVRKSDTEQLVGALRGQENVQYTFHTLASVPLDKDDRIMYNENGVKKYLRLTSSADINTVKSQQTDWKSYSAESYVPTAVVVE